MPVRRPTGGGRGALRCTLILAALLLLSRCTGDDAVCDDDAYAGSAECRQPKVLLIGVEGLRPDAVEALIASRAASGDEQAGLHRLAHRGAYAPNASASDISTRGPGWASILLGTRRDRHLVDGDDLSAAVGEGLLSRLETYDARRRTALIAQWDALPALSQGADVTKVARDDPAGAAAALIAGAESPDLIVVQLAGLLEVGKEHGFSARSGPYMMKLETIDGAIGRIVEATAGRPALERWLIIVVGVHGGRPDGLYGTEDPEDRTVPLILHGTTVIRAAPHPAPRLIDVAPTALSHLGVPAEDLPGAAVGLSPSARPLPGLSRNIIDKPDAEHEPASAVPTMSIGIAGWWTRGRATVLEYRTQGLGGTGQLYASSAGLLASLSQSLEVAPLAFDRPTRFELGGRFGGAMAGDRGRLVARFSSGTRYAAVNWNNGKAYFFRDSRYWRYDTGARRFDAGYPQPINLASWLGLGSFRDGAHDLDAAVHWGNRKAYFFKGDQMIIWDIARDAAFPDTAFDIGTELPGLDRFAGGARDIDAATASGDGKVHFFKGDEYIRFDQGARQADDGYPRKISYSTWRGLHVWPANIEAAVFNPQGEHTFMRGGSFIRFQADIKRATAAPQPIDDVSWPPHLEDWTFADRAAAVQWTAGAGQQVGLATVTGTVPPSTTRIDIELLLIPTSTAGTAYGDDLSLTLSR